MPKRSAGLLLYRRAPQLEVLLALPGGPLHAGKDVWTVPKGEYGDDEQPLAAAYREWAEELGSLPPDGDPVPLGEVVQKSGKHVVAWALEGDLDVTSVVSNTFSMVWRGTRQDFPEVERAQWMGLEEARRRIMPAQVPLLDALEDAVG